MKGKTWQGMAAAGLLLAGGVAQAALVPYTVNGVDVVVDTDYTPVGATSPGLMWTKNANLAASMNFGVSGINANGSMTWAKALEWIAAMNTASYAGFSDWRLWSALNSDGSGPCGPGFNCNDSELGHLFYVEGGLSQNQAITSSTALTAVFTNMQDSVYWSGTEYAPNPLNAWNFFTDDGFQYPDNKFNQYYGWAVRPGQVAAAPLPGTALLMALGFGAMAVSHRARRRLW
ncbi:DUF1566 domain-containing protein [uncultured Thiohalocapsa sp.]|uniref:Lcl C-terminal domain-containing protein n=1 Tax=uncultured Thiohalocapsa sp. TaxID=768990 RepID=UPI0025CF365B|nr:DUF1566 domain-containing protein [uncultured Thiohalocapsa sp.]